MVGTSTTGPEEQPCDAVMSRDTHNDPRRGFSPPERPRVWLAAAVTFGIGLSPGLAVWLTPATSVGGVVQAWVVGTIVVGPVIGARLLPYPHLGTAAIVASSFVLGFNGSAWLAALEPAHSEVALVLIGLLALSPIYFLALLLPIYLVSSWRRRRLTRRRNRCS